MPAAVNRYPSAEAAPSDDKNSSPKGGQCFKCDSGNCEHEHVDSWPSYCKGFPWLKEVPTREKKDWKQERTVSNACNRRGSYGQRQTKFDSYCACGDINKAWASSNFVEHEQDAPHQCRDKRNKDVQCKPNVGREYDSRFPPTMWVLFQVKQLTNLKYSRSSTAVSRRLRLLPGALCRWSASFMTFTNCRNSMFSLAK